jgi:lipid II:glycine glycyltransferase (peptidoglycan interpeptide bridge formation enzyme)
MAASRHDQGVGRIGAIPISVGRSALAPLAWLAGHPGSATRPTLVSAANFTPASWDRLAVRSPFGHAFQSHAWGELKRGLGWTPQRHLVELEGEVIAVVASLSRSLLGLGPLGKVRYLYVPRGPILLRRDAVSARASLRAVRDLATAEGAILVTVDPSWPAGGSLASQLKRSGYTRAARDVQVSRTATLVPLHPAEGEQHRLLRKSTANLVNRARREGATVERIELTIAPDDPPETRHRREQALEEMHELLAATARRKGVGLRDRAYQLAQWRGLGEAGLASLWFAGVGGRRWTGSVLLNCGSTLHQYQAGSGDIADLRRVPANHLLQWEIIRWAAAASFARYDLGGVDAPRARGVPRDAGHPLWDLYLFKRGFGAEGIEYVPAHECAANPLVAAAWRLARRLR